ncbi:hypothetical protein CEP53_013229 [Fusarium sp. AF-6]|nr:hypothetical protein CEP53_013229 [Fusarium sp. AF-6]
MSVQEPTEQSGAEVNTRANVDVLDEKGMLALHVRVQKLVEQYGAEVNTRDQYGDSPLHEACNNCNANTVKLLLSAGADREVKNIEGKTPKEALNDSGSEDKGKAEIKTLLTKPALVGTRKYVPKIPQFLPKCLPREESTCKDFTAYVRYYRRGSSHTQATSTTIHGLVYESESTLKQIEKDFVGSQEDQGKPDDTGVWRWVHFPANNMTWIRDFIHTITEKLEHAEKERVWKFVECTMKDRKLVTKHGCSRVAHVEDWPKEGQLEANGNIHPHDSRPGDSNPSHKAEPAQDKTSSSSSPAGALSDKRLSIVCPYIDFETEEYIGYKYQIRRHSHEQNLTEHSRKMILLEKTYPPLSGLAGLQVPQTLDSSYYDTLEEEKLLFRDQDQVVLKWFKSEKNRTNMSEQSRPQSASSTQPTVEHDQGTTDAERPLSLKSPAGRRPMGMRAQPKLLMIHQLWLWKLDENTIITSCPDRWHAGVEDTLIDTIRQSGVEHLNEPEDLIQHIMNVCVRFLDEFRDAGVGEHILDIFDSSVSQTAQSEVEAFKNFQKLTAGDGVQQLSVSRRKDMLSVAEEIKLMYEVKDLRDEILLLQRVFDTQAEVLKKLARILWSDAEEAKQSRENYIDMCGTMDLIERAERLDKNAGRTLQGLDYLVQVKQAQSSLYEAKTTGTLNNYIMVFTIVTILFTNTVLLMASSGW